MSDIFLSHVEEDKDQAFAIAMGLETAGYSVWYYERDSLPGQPYLLQVGHEIEQARAVVLLASLHALGSVQVTNEIIRAYESAKPFLPVLHGVTHAGLQKRRPDWRQCLGAATSIAIPPEGPNAVVPRLLEGLRAMGLEPRQPASTAPFASLPPASHVQDVSADSRLAKPDRSPSIGLRHAVLLTVLLMLGIVAAFIYFRTQPVSKVEREVEPGRLRLTGGPPPDVSEWQRDLDSLREFLDELEPMFSLLHSDPRRLREGNAVNSFKLATIVNVSGSGLRNVGQGKYFWAGTCFSQAHSFIDPAEKRRLAELQRSGEITFSPDALTDCLGRLKDIAAREEAELVPVYILVIEATGSFLDVPASSFVEQVISHAETAFRGAEIPVKRWPHPTGSEYTCEISYSIEQQGELGSTPAIPRIHLPGHDIDEEEGLICKAQYTVRITDNRSGKTILEFEDTGEYHDSGFHVVTYSTREELARSVFSPECFSLEKHFEALSSNSQDKM